jgi:hypothetical protein
VAAISALLDSCVLYPARLRDLLLSLAAADLFRPIWTEAIHKEWMTGVLVNRPDLTRSQLEAARGAMDRAFPASSISGFESLIPAFSLPDPDDRHVLAAAVHVKADLIVTTNLKDFPSGVLALHGIVVLSTGTSISCCCAKKGRAEVSTEAKRAMSRPAGQERISAGRPGTPSDSLSADYNKWRTSLANDSVACSVKTESWWLKASHPCAASCRACLMMEKRN